MIKRINKYKDISIVSFVLIFIGFLSLSFLGTDMKIVRIICNLSVLLLLLNRFLRTNNTINLNDSIFKLLILFLVLLIPSVFVSKMPFFTAYKLMDVFVMVMLILIISRKFVLNRKGFSFLHFVLWYFFAQTFLSLAFYIIDPSSVSRTAEIGVTFLSSNYPQIHSNTLGSFAGVAALFMIYNIQRTRKIIFYVFLVFCVLVLFLTSSRTSLIAFLISLLFYLYHTLLFSKKIIFASFLLILFLSFSTSIINYTQSFIYKTLDNDKISQSENSLDMILSGRLSIWEEIVSKPEIFFLGKGFGTAMLTDNISNNTNAHNSIAEILINAGALPTIIWLLIWFKLYKYFNVFKSKSNVLLYDSKFYILSFSILILVFIRSLGNATFVYFQLFDWIMVGIISFYIYSFNYLKNAEIQVKKKKSKT